MENEQALKDIAFLKQVINDTQRAFVEDGKHYMLWSSLAIVGLLVKYLKKAIILNFSDLWIWMPAILLGVAGSLALRKQNYLK